MTTGAQAVSSGVGTPSLCEVLKLRSELVKGVSKETPQMKETNTKNSSCKKDSKESTVSSPHHLNLLATEKSALLDWKILKITSLFYVCLYLASSNQLSSYSNFFSKFFTLSYKYDNQPYYDIGFDDIYFTAFWIINLIFLRSFLIVFCFKPCARLLGLKNFNKIQRFIEQSWSIFYYSISWSFGFYLYYKSDYFFNCYNIYSNWPHDKLSREIKIYYLVQTASWFQQFIVIHLEEKRKDYVQMVSHHIITCMLCTGSYIYYFTRIGHIILLLMDIVDVFLSTAKILKYCGFQTICDVMFLTFMLCWIVLRHGIYNYVLYFSWHNARDIMNFNCSKFKPGEYVKICYTDLQINVLLSLLLFLQVIMCIWMYMILRVAIRVIRGGSADDVRSGSESD